MVSYNDVGLTLEILGFCVFLFISVIPSNSLGLSQADKIEKFFRKHRDFEKILRYLGICGVIAGLLMQYSEISDKVFL